ncbi:hypothetical protein Btru_017894 [Bulinus truncatus]|nr:hypothetical protein Btru_017894 [Bulinus truncatus]
MLVGVFVIRISEIDSWKCKKKKVKEEKKSLIIGPMLRKRSRDEPPFVVPQIFVDYGSRRTSYASTTDFMMLGNSP